MSALAKNTYTFFPQPKYKSRERERERKWKEYVDDGVVTYNQLIWSVQWFSEVF